MLLLLLLLTQQQDMYGTYAPWHCYSRLRIFKKLRNARSRLYRRRSFQVNAHFAAFLELYQILPIAFKIFASFSRLLHNLCKQILIFQHFSRSTRLSHLCTPRNWKSQQIFVKLFSFLMKSEISAKFDKIRKFSEIFIEICTDFDQMFSEFHQIF